MALVVTDPPTFSDAELTSLATEILDDLSSKHTGIQIDSTNLFICELADEIEQESMADINLSLIMGSDSSSFIHQTSTSPSSRLQILSPYELSLNDSFNLSLPTIPSPSCSPLPQITTPCKSAPVPRRRRFKSPMCPPPQRRFAVASAPVPKKPALKPVVPPLEQPEIEELNLSRRNIKQIPAKVSTVPNFLDCTHVIITKLPKEPHLKKERKTKNQKSYQLHSKTNKSVGYQKSYQLHSTTREFYKQKTQAKLQHIMNMQ